jgi:hypothetical protein
VYLVGTQLGQVTGVEKGTIKQESYPHHLGGARFAVAFWDRDKDEFKEGESHAIRAPFNVCTEEEVLRAIASNGGLVRADADKTVDQLVISQTGNDELVQILSDRLAEKREF